MGCSERTEGGNHDIKTASLTRLFIRSVRHKGRVVFKALRY